MPQLYLWTVGRTREEPGSDPHKNPSISSVLLCLIPRLSSVSHFSLLFYLTLLLLLTLPILPCLFIPLPSILPIYCYNLSLPRDPNEAFKHFPGQCWERSICLLIEKVCWTLRLLPGNIFRCVHILC